MTMGTASTMASLVEALGMSLPENAAIPAVDSRRMRLAHLSGRRIVEMVREDLRMSKVLTRAAFANAIRANAAIGGSTNAVIHLLALAGRLGVPLTLADWDRVGSHLPCLVNLKPSGQYLMEDFYYAGGLPAVLREITPHLDLDALTVNANGFPYFICGDPATTEFCDAQRKYGPVQVYGIGNSIGWTAGKAFEFAAQHVSDNPTSAEILNGLWSFKNETLGGLTHPLTFTKGQNAPRMPCWWQLILDKGKWTAPNGMKVACH